MSWVLDARVRSAMISDALDSIGVRHQVMAKEIEPLRPSMRCAGIATTIAFEPDENFDQNDPYGDAIDFLDGLKPGSVAVVSTSGESRSAFWGELFSAAATGRGATGVICDGPLRDTEQVVDIGFAAFGVGSRPIDYKGRMRVVATHIPVGCGGVTVHPGDGVIADHDGVVVVPAAHLAQITAIAEERAKSERTVLKDLLAGSSVRQVWDAYRIL